MKWFGLLLTSLLIFGAVSCSNDDDGNEGPAVPEDNIVEIASATPDLSSLVAALTAADALPSVDLIGTLSGNGPFTVFAPTNAAFSALLGQLDGYNSLDDFDTDEELELLAEILSYHVVAGVAAESTSLSDGGTVTTVQGESITTRLSGGVSIEDASDTPANVTTADVLASNGVIHIIDKVLLPQAVIDALEAAAAEKDIVDLASENSDLSALVAALTEADLVSALQAEGPFTVFAPTNDAFATFLATNGFANVGEVPDDLLSQVLLNHVVSGSFESTALSTGYVSSLSTAGPDDANLSLFIDTEGGVTINGGSSVSTADVTASNGIIHIVDAVIGLPTVVDHATANNNFSSLVDALTAGTPGTDFVSVLSGDGPFTVFAPDNDAFSAFTNPDGNALENILSNHVISGEAAFSTALTNAYVQTLGTNADGDALSLYINTDNGVTLNGISSVAAADVVATNGVIHAVDAVIDIPTVVTFAAADPTFSTLVTALTDLTPGTDFVATLSGDGPFTVFAPTNDAFDALDAIPEESVLTQVLLHHVVSGNVRSADLTDGIMPETLEGDMITINLPGTGDNIADITDGAGNTGIGIIDVDVQAGNGVIHVLDQVMIPDTMN